MRLGSAERSTATNKGTPSKRQDFGGSVGCSDQETRRRCVSVPLESDLAPESSARCSHVCPLYKENKRESPTKTNDWRFLPRIRGHFATQRRSHKSSTELFRVYQDTEHNRMAATQPFQTSRSQIDYMQHSILSEQEKNELIAVLDLRPLRQYPTQNIECKTPAARGPCHLQKAESARNRLTKEEPIVDPELKLIQTHAAAPYKFGKDSQELPLNQIDPLEPTQSSVASATLLKLAPALSFPLQSSLENLPRFNQKYIPAKTQSNSNSGRGENVTNQKKEGSTRQELSRIKMPSYSNAQIEASSSEGIHIDSTLEELSFDESSIGDFDLEADIRLDENILAGIHALLESRSISKAWISQHSTKKQLTVRIAESFELPMRWIDNPTIETEYFVRRKRGGDLSALLKLQTQMLI